MNVLELTLKKLLQTPTGEPSAKQSNSTRNAAKLHGSQNRKFDLLRPLKQRLDRIQVGNPKSARLLCKLIPAQCPFEREIKLFGKVLFRIPPLCKINPLYEQLMSLRFRALCYLVEECGEESSAYC